MTVPDKLVKVAAEAIRCVNEWNVDECHEGDPCHVCLDVARIALAATFAALPWCEEARAALVDVNLATSVLIVGDGQPALRVRDNGEAADMALAALANL